MYQDLLGYEVFANLVSDWLIRVVDGAVARDMTVVSNASLLPLPLDPRPYKATVPKNVSPSRFLPSRFA